MDMCVFVGSGPPIKTYSTFLAQPCGRFSPYFRPSNLPPFGGTVSGRGGHR